MDCITISTYRNLELQAIRQHKELKLKEATYKGGVGLHEESTNNTKTSNEVVIKNTTKGKLDYYA